MNKLIIENNKIILNETKLEVINKNNFIIINSKKSEKIELVIKKNVNLQFNILDNVNLEINNILTKGSLKSEMEYNVFKNSNLEINKFYNLNKVIENVKINLNKEKSSINYYFSNLSCEDQKYNIEINHNSKNTKSNIVNHSVSIENKKQEFNVISKIKKNCSKSDANQETRIIAFDTKTAIIKPKLIIDETDVNARHKATIGSLKDYEMFYLQSRGINKKDAIKLIIKGFLISNINKDFKEIVFNIINKE